MRSRKKALPDPPKKSLSAGSSSTLNTVAPTLWLVHPLHSRIEEAQKDIRRGARDKSARRVGSFKTVSHRCTVISLYLLALIRHHCCSLPRIIKYLPSCLPAYQSHCLLPSYVLNYHVARIISAEPPLSPIKFSGWTDTQSVEQEQVQEASHNVGGPTGTTKAKHCLCHGGKSLHGVSCWAEQAA